MTHSTPNAHDIIMFENSSTARAVLTPGTVYATLGEAGWLYYGQVTPEKSIGFFRYRSRDLELPDAVLDVPMMSVVKVEYPSITRALRSGIWKKLGRFPLAPELNESRQIVQWPTGTMSVFVSVGHDPVYETRVDDPKIQDGELMAVWDAELHIPARLTADFGEEDAMWHVGGPIWRQRRVKEEYARRFPDAPWHQLPLGWVHTADN